ncbi:hypothetical protein M3P05_01065 [Sansalvadorimonas sp. 2012CJ34-2]|uniref:Uncharacterized protein n=1 Tax=Parendozoicomonas callyspongiae TaxID=2942213 RepID=A0ABT0PAX3_9GAMM|nr:hypothetical protein [Sansalvadorimonas sp. 2012CJ34-2]MCL6268542.1 hypothetical protein [Sansalvadorimonas sp. 2012CJ34-2]
MPKTRASPLFYKAHLLCFLFIFLITPSYQLVLAGIGQTSPISSLSHPSSSSTDSSSDSDSASGEDNVNPKPQELSPSNNRREDLRRIFASTKAPPPKRSPMHTTACPTLPVQQSSDISLLDDKEEHNSYDESTYSKNLGVTISLDRIYSDEPLFLKVHIPKYIYGKLKKQKKKSTKPVKQVFVVSKEDKSKTTTQRTSRSSLRAQFIRSTSIESDSGLDSESDSEEWIPTTQKRKTIIINDSGSSSDEESSDDECISVQANYKGLAYHPYNKEKLKSVLESMIREGMNDKGYYNEDRMFSDCECAKSLNSGRYGMPPQLNKYTHWNAPAVRDAIQALEIDDTRNLDERRRTKRITPETLKKRFDTYLKAGSRKSTPKNGILPGGYNADGRIAYLFNKCGLPVPKALTYVETQRKKKQRYNPDKLKDLIEKAKPEGKKVRWTALRIRLAIQYYQIHDPRLEQHTRKKINLIERANDSIPALKLLLLEYLVDYGQSHTDFGYVAKRLDGKVFVPKVIREERGITEETMEWNPLLIQTAVEIFEFHKYDHLVRQRFVRKDELVQGMRDGEVNDDRRILYVKEYLLACLEDMMLLKAPNIYTRIASRIRNLGVEFPTKIVIRSDFTGTNWTAGWVRAAFNAFKIKIPVKVKIQRRFWIKKMRESPVNSPEHNQAIRDYVESLSSTRTYKQIADNLNDLARGKDCKVDPKKAIYIPVLYGGSPPDRHLSCHWMSYNIALIMGNFSEGGHTRPDLIEVIRDESAEMPERLLALSQYIDHIKFFFSMNNPKPLGKKAEKTGSTLGWERNLYKRLKDTLNQTGIFIPQQVLHDANETVSVYKPMWSLRMAEIADQKLGEYLYTHEEMGNKENTYEDDIDDNELDLDLDIEDDPALDTLDVDVDVDVDVDLVLPKRSNFTVYTIPKLSDKNMAFVEEKAKVATTTELPKTDTKKTSYRPLQLSTKSSSNTHSHRSSQSHRCCSSSHQVDKERTHRAESRYPPRHRHLSPTTRARNKLSQYHQPLGSSSSHFREKSHSKYDHQDHSFRHISSDRHSSSNQSQQPPLQTDYKYFFEPISP